MTGHSTPTHEKDSEYLKLLRSALRSKISLLALGLVLTWGLWATLQTGEEKLPSVADECTKRLVEFKSKWGLSPDVPINFDSTMTDVFSHLGELKDTDALKKTPGKWYQFYTELQAEGKSCDQQVTASYSVKIRVPYLVQPTSVDGLAIANLWPFVMIAIASAVFVFEMRERANALVLSWMAFGKPNAEQRELLRIRSDYRVGEMIERTFGNRKFLFYKSPLVIHPESLLTYALLGFTVYASISIAATHRIELSNEMRSVLFDYFSALWFFSAGMGYLVFRTRRYYHAQLESLVGRPVFGATRSRLFQPSRFFDEPFDPNRAPIDLRILSKLENVWKRRHVLPKWLEGILLPVAALASLALPWMQPGSVRGYNFLLGRSNLDDDLATELQYQLVLAIVFTLLCVVRTLTRCRISRQSFLILTEWVRRFGWGVILLVGNLVFHLFVLLFLVDALQLGALSLAATKPLIRTDPGIGLRIFCMLIVLIVISLFEESTRSALTVRPEV